MGIPILKKPAAFCAASFLLFFAPSALSADHAESAEQLKFFETRIRPVLADNCYQCHGEEKQKAGLRLDRLTHLTTGSEEGPVLVKGDATKSLLFTAISYEDADLQMPPKDKKLPANQIDDLKKWINMGAPWPEDDKTNVPNSGEFTEGERAWWSFQPLMDVTPPTINAATGTAKNDIDKFILAKLGENDLKQAPEATPEELVRRLYFNLHGLPPTQERLDAYLADTSPDKYEKLVDELLASSRYGERWGQHWLDLARYAESDGYRADAYRPDAWRYRDYVIKSFNEDKPYDQFVREQLAGDEIAPDDPEVLVATGFLRNGIYEYNQADAEMHRELIVTELADVTGELFLGLSYGCAKCHDHKFDPILQKDYFRMLSFFTPMQFRDDLPLASIEEKKTYTDATAIWEEESKEPREAWEAASVSAFTNARDGNLKIFPPEVQEMYNKPKAERTPHEELIVYFVDRRIRENTNVGINGLKGNSEEYKAFKPFDDKKPKALPTAFVATDVGAEAPPTIMESRSGKTVVEPGFLTIIAPDDIQVESLPDKNSTGRRTALANWITSPENPLSTRVIVNRVWQYHFGRGLSVHTSDFGKLGEAPTHPELLDWLTKGFIENGWSLKWLHRQILKTQTYRQSSLVLSTDTSNKMDPENRLLWRMRPQRLDAEQARDTLLMLSGSLQQKSGGPASDGNSPVPSIYTKKQRNSPDEFLSRFDSPAGFLSVAKRETTNTPLQSLLMINGPWPLQRAMSISAKIIRENPSATQSELAGKALETVYGRKPKLNEISAGTAFLAKHHKMIEVERADKARDLEAAKDSPLVDAAKFFGNAVKAGEQSAFFNEGSNFPKLLAKPSTPESLDFTVEAMVNLEKVYPSGAVRTIASRWNGNYATYGWEVGVTGVKSRYAPNLLIVQILGGDFQDALSAEALNSGLTISSGKPYYISVSFSTEKLPGTKFGGHIIFRVKDLSDPKAEMQVSKIPHGIGSGYVNQDNQFVIGGRDRNTGHNWLGAIHRLSSSEGVLPPEEKPFESKLPSLVNFMANSLSSSDRALFKWITPPDPAAKTQNPVKVEALGDLFHALINSNEFLYLP